MADFNDLNNLNATPDYTTSFDPADVQSNKVMGVLAYLSWLVLIPLFAARNSPFARFHCNQGIVLALAEVLAGVILAGFAVCYFILTISGIRLTDSRKKKKE